MLVLHLIFYYPVHFAVMRHSLAKVPALESNGTRPCAAPIANTRLINRRRGWLSPSPQVCRMDIIEMPFKWFILFTIIPNLVCFATVMVRFAVGHSNPQPSYVLFPILAWHITPLTLLFVDCTDYSELQHHLGAHRGHRRHVALLHRTW